MAAGVEVKHLVLSHVGKVTQQDQALIERHFNGKLTLGRDLAENEF